jgi:hypothetical protein
MRPSSFLVLIVLTCGAGYLYGKHVLRLPTRGLFRAWKTLLECVGLGVAFFVLNLLVALVAIMVLRLTGYFVSLYLGTDIALVVFSFLQGTVFQFWRRGAMTTEPVERSD